ncbi:sensor histidine kinase [Microbacterium dauci]|uniref:histidine kinase n=1 Tax=Microbacterium dauci TaxID=3048008 RepID=A0ABT6ZGV7_9MICO|nr:HAMP domain-containing sensor histidine kinase [Microbacterium sp. LX3-4]MDJ1115183.1 HAMP domain-containing sensor histidine kinase [Microbacterium sp. LX3-4]
MSTATPERREDAPSEVRRGGIARFLRSDAGRMPLTELRDRVVANNQILLAGIVAAIYLSGIAAGWLADVPQFAAGVAIIVVAALASLAVPWSRLPPAWVAVVPLVDIVAIALMRVSDVPGVALLWAFPTMWLSTMGRAWFIIACVSVIGAYWTTQALIPNFEWNWAVIVLPAVIIAIGASTHNATRRFIAQRVLLDKQTGRLTAALRHASKQELLLAEVLDTVDFGVLRIAANGEITFVNDALGRFQQRIPGFGKLDSVTEIYAADGQTLLDPHDRPLSRIVRGEAFDDLVVWFPISDSRRAALSLTARRLTDAEGHPAGVVLVARDVTDERTALKARDSLVASVSHELRTPLTSILGYLELALDSGELPDAARRQIDVAYRNSERLLGIVSGILAASTASRMSAEVTISPEYFDVATLLRASASDLGPVAKERAIKIDVDDVVPAPAFIDPARMRQVIDNLVSNAIKFNRDGGVVTLGSSSDGTHTWFLVRDSGIGLSEDDRQRVFERFFRAESGVPGTGLGLAISLEIVRAHGGDITVTSTLGLGTTFMVQLPANAEIAASEVTITEEGD